MILQINKKEEQQLTSTSLRMEYLSSLSSHSGLQDIHSWIQG